MNTARADLRPARVEADLTHRRLTAGLDAQAVHVQLPSAGTAAPPPSGYGFGLGPFGGPSNPFGGTP